MIGWAPPPVLVFAHFRHVLVGGPGDADGGDRRDRPGPGERLADHQIAVAERERVVLGHAAVLEPDRVVLAQPVTDLGDRGVVGDAGRAARHDQRAEPALTTLIGRGAHDADVDVGALEVPAAGVAGPVFGAVEHVFAAPRVVARDQPDAGRQGARMVEIGGTAGRPRRLADRPAGQVFAARIAGRLAQPLLLLRLAAEPRDRPQRQTIHQKDGREARVDRGDLLGDDLQVDVADPAAAIGFRQETHREAQLVGLDIGALHHPEGGLRIGLLVGLAHQRAEDLAGELARVPLQPPLGVGQREVDRHRDAPGCVASASSWTAAPWPVPDFRNHS